MQYRTHPQLGTTPHGFFTRNGGVSTGVYTTANMSYASGDKAQNITKNRHRVKQALGLKHLITLHQVHGDTVHTITADTIQNFQNTAIKGDGLVCAMASVGIGVLTADCTPVLFIDTHNQVAGACHAGWGGAKQGIMLRTVDTMIQAGANISTIVAVIGPSIAQSSYEVDNNFKNNFCKDTSDYSTFFIPWRDLNTTIPAINTESYGFDLTGFIKHSLWAYGVRTYTIDDGDTYTQDDIFFSYRRATHLGETDYGRQISVISI